MAIGFDTSPLTHPHSPGVRRVTEELVEALERRGHLEIVRLTPDPGERLRNWRQLGLPREAARRGLAGIHAPGSAFPLFGPGRRVQTVHELPWKHGVAENAGLSHRFWAGPAGRKADAVIVPTGHVARDLGRPLAADGGRIHICSWAASLPFGPKPPADQLDEPVLDRYHLPDTAFLLAPGAVRAKKNLAAILAGLAEFAKTGGPRLLLVITGPETGDLRRDLGLASRLGVAGQISTLGHVPDGDLAALTRLASAVIVLSASEGFGLPALEAAACGTPVILNASGAPAEVVGQAAITVDAAESADVASGIRRALDEGPGLRPRLLERAARFSWDRTAATVEGIWETLL